MDLNTFIQNNLALLERYILAEDKPAFLNKELTVPQDRKIFDFLLESLSDKDKQLVKEFKLTSEGTSQLLNSKTIRELYSVTGKEQQTKLIDKIKRISDQFFFDFPKPVEINQFRQTGVEDGQKPESISKQVFETEKTVQEVIKRALKEDPSNFFKLSHYGLKNLPSEYLSNLKENQFQFLFEKRQIIRSMNPEGIAQFLVNLIKKLSEEKKSSIEEEFPEEFFQILSFEQVQALKRKNPKLVESQAYHMKMFRLKYQVQFKKVRNTPSLTFEERQRKRILCVQALEQVSQQGKVYFEHLKQKLTEEILLIDEANVDSKLPFFISYLNNIKSIVFRSFEQKFQDRIKNAFGRNKYQNRRHINIDFLYSSQFDQSSIIPRIVASLFKNWDADIVPELSKYIDRKYLVKQQALGLLSKGKQKQIKDLLEIISSSQLNSLKEKKQITFLESNKKIFKPKDQVKLDVRIKNISKILKKIYTVDLQKLLLENNSSIDNNINLKFLVPQYQEQIQINSIDPFEEVKVQLKFPQLEKKLGQFIIEIEGDGILSRAIVRKGKVIVENTLISTGHELTFYDQEGQQISELFIWRNSKKIHVKQSYKIPFGPQGSERIIAVYNGHAQALDVLIQTEGYSFECEYLYHSETFIVGNKAKVIIHPVLRLNGEHASPSRIRNLSINVSSVNNQNISSSQLYQNVSFKESEDYVLEYPIKAYIKSFNIKVTGQIELINKQILNVNHQKNIAIDLEESNNNFIDLYLEQSYQGSYKLKVRGKNGEGIPNSQVILSYQQFGLNFAFSKQLTSDQKGQVLLGKLAQVTTLIVTVTSNNFNSKRSWKLNNFGETISYGSLGHAFGGYEVYLQEGDSFSLPLPSELCLQTDLILEKMHQEITIYHDLTNTIKLNKDKLLIENLQLGSYTLILLRYNRKIQISVLKAKKWNKNKLIDEDNMIYSLKKKNEYISLGQLTAEAKEDHIECSILVKTSNEELPPDLRIHVFAKNYIDSSNIEIINLENRIYCNIPQKQCLILNQTSYLQNKTLSDQISYALNRRNQQIANGNNLQKPHVFLKRIEVRDTITKDEVLNRESSFGDREMHADVFMAKCGAPRMMACRSPDYLYGANFSSAYPSLVTIQRNLNSHNNFYYKVGHLSHNLKNLQKFKIPKGYNQVDVYLFSKNIVLKKQYSIPEGSDSKLKLTHSSIRDNNSKQAWTMSRQIYPIQRNQRRQISRNSTWTTVSLENIAKYASLQGITLPQWFLGWKNYSNQKKLEIYDKEVCHELNFFIYRHDKAFFKEVVEGFISNKLNKTFVDHYLLNNKPQLIESNNTYQLRKLNAFEKVLLVEKLKDYGLNEQAEYLALSLQLPLKTTKLSNQQFKVFFETLLNAKKEVKPAPQAYQNFQMSSQGSFGGGFGGARPPPPMMQMCTRQAQIQTYCMEAEERQQCLMLEQQCCDIDYKEIQAAKQNYKPGFKETQKTKQYTQTTYSGIVNQKTQDLIWNNLFWAELAKHLCSRKDNEDFLTDKFNYLSSKLEFVLGCAFLVNDSQSDYELENSENGYFITAKNSFLVFVREVKSLPFQPFKSVVLNQRFFDPKNRQKVDDEGQSIQIQVETFIIHKPYTIQTLVTNISSSNLELQLLMDIPEGSVPLLSHEQTQIINISLPAYNTKSFERQFYFPEVGKYNFYPANVCRGKTIIAKSAEVQSIEVLAREILTKLQSFDNVLKSGDDREILNFLRNKNIFNPNIFDINQILWKLKDFEFYRQVIAILKDRKYYHPIVWSFSIYHNDFEIAKEFFESNMEAIPYSKINQPILEYYPYYSRRVHKFANENKSTIRVKEFKDNYELFILSSIFNKNIDKQSTTLALIYYLLLQDRITEARTIFKNLSASARNLHKLQYDYIDCFLDMFDGSNTNYQIARKLSSQYSNYPVLTWRKLFKQVFDLLNKSEDAQSDDSTKGQEVLFSTTVVNSGSEIKINRPSQGKVVVNLYEIDIQLYFSEFAFSDITNFSCISPKKTLLFEGADFKVQKLERKDYEGMKDIYVDIYEQKGNNVLTKVTSFFWTNPDVKVKINEKQGTLKVFYKNKKCPTSYCKIYSQGSKGVRFSRDGYTDIAATFRYALDVSNITQFSILVLTQYGGSIHRVKPPVPN